MRINARLDEYHTRKLEYLRQYTGHRVSDVVKEAIDVYYEKVRDTSTRPANILTDVGFVACGEVEPELSESYKQLLRGSLAAKHGDR